MTESEFPAQWLYPLLAVSEDKHASRVAVANGFASELVGVDGNSESGLRPFPGLKLVRELQPKIVTTGIELLPSFTGRSELLDVFQVHFRVGTDGYGFGFIYRITKDPNYVIGASVATDEGADIFFDFWSTHPAPGAVAQWSDGNTFDNRVVVNCDPGVPMSVSVSNNGLIYISVGGRGASLCYQDKTAPYALIRVGDTGAPFPGAGLQPKLLAPENGVALGAVAVIDNVNRPGSGQIWLGTTAPSAAGLGLTQTDAEPRLMPSGAYSFAYQLYDSKTGRRSALSEAAWANLEDFTADPSYFVLELLHDANKFDQAYVYRSVRVQDAGGTYVATYLHLERIITLEDYASNLATTYPFQHSVYYYVLEDKALVFQDYFQDRSLFDEVMPRGGASIMFGNTLLVSKITGRNPSSTEENRPDDATRGLGELRYSSLTDISPELFPPSNRYVPSTPSNEIISFAQVGDTVVGWSLDRQYYIRKSGTYLQVYEAHEGFGTTGPFSTETMSSSAYFLTHKGLKMIDVNAQLEDVKAFNKVIMEDWTPTERLTVSIAFDPTLSALFIHNPTRMQTLGLWFNTGKATELFDMPFIKTFAGVWPSDLDDLSSDLIGRAFFAQDCPDHATSDDFLPDWRPRIFVVDAGRDKINQTMMDVEASDATADYFFPTVECAGGLLELDTTGLVLGGNFEGAFIYVLDSSDPDFIGAKSQIAWSTDAVTLSLTTNALDGLPAGSVVGLSPVYFRWVGSPVTKRITSDQGTFDQGQDFHRIKQVESIVCAFTDVAGDATGTTNAKYRGLCYMGSDETPLSAVPPLGEAAGASVESVISREGRNAAYFRDEDSTSEVAHGVTGNCLTPGVEVFCPNLDFRLVSAMVTGKILGATRSRNSS